MPRIALLACATLLVAGAALLYFFTLPPTIATRDIEAMAVEEEALRPLQQEREPDPSYTNRSVPSKGPGIVQAMPMDATTATVRGRLLDYRGDPILSHWSVDLQWAEMSTPSNVPRPDISDSEPSEHFEITSVPPGKWRLRARNQLFDLATMELQLAPGEVREVVVRQTNTRDARSELTLIALSQRPLMPAPSRDHIRLVHPGGTLQAPDPKNSTDHDNALRFSHLDASAYRLEINDPRYEPWAADDLHPGQKPIQAVLRGTSAVRFVVTDALRSTVIEDFAIELRQHRSAEPGGGSSSRGSSTSSARRAFSKHPGGVLHFDALVAGDLRFAVEAPGYPLRLIEVVQLTVGETRTVELAMHAGITVRGIVRTLSGTPIENARLAVSPLAVEPKDASDTRPALQKMRATSDSAGRFEFKDLDAGSWICEATVPIKKLDLTRVPHPAFVRPEQQQFVLGAHVPPPFLEFALPTGAVLFGTALLTEGSVPDEMGIALKWLEHPGVPAHAHRGYSVVSELDRQGNYRIEGLAAGQYQVGVVVPKSSQDRLTNTLEKSRELAFRLLHTLQIEDSAVLRRDYDLRHHAPAAIHAHVKTSTSPLIATLRIIDIDLLAASGNPPRQQSYTPFSVRGIASHTRLFAGRKCCFALAANGTWAHIFTRDLELRSGSTHNVEATLVFHDGRLSVLTPDGTPGANLLLNLAPIFEPPLAEASYGGELKLDAGGVAQVRLPPGRYRISTRISRTELSPSAAVFDWPSTDLLQVQLQR